MIFGLNNILNTFIKRDKDDLADLNLYIYLIYLCDLFKY